MSVKVIAIDGPAYSGKSQIAKEIAKKTGFEYINTGHMYRALAKVALEKGVSSSDEAGILALPCDISFSGGKTLVNGADWTDRLDATEIVKMASEIALLPKIRERLTALQREYAKKNYIIMEGRDIGSSVFPDAQCRIYVTASDEVRAKRLYKMMPDEEKKSLPLTEDTIQKLLVEKLRPIDQRDFNRTLSPLISVDQARTKGYFVYDNSAVPTAKEDAENLYKNYLRSRLNLEKSQELEPISELRRICQTTAQKDKSNVYMRYICRPLSIYGTRLLLPTSVTADQVSMAMIAMGFIANFFFLFPSKGAFFFGAILLQVWYLLDCMDGEVARYRHYKTTGSVVIDKRQSSLTGLYYDMINHYIVNFLVPSSVGFGLFQNTGNAFWILLGGLGALSQVLMLAMHDAKCRAILAHLKKYSLIEPSAEKKSEQDVKPRSLAHNIFAGIHYSVTYPTVMNLTAMAALLNLFFSSADFRFPMFIYICLATTLVSTVLIVRILKNRIVDEELKASFRLTDSSAFGNSK